MCPIQMTEASSCPLLMLPVRMLRDGPTATYCRSPQGGVRVPSRNELSRLCSSGRHRECVGYRRVTAADMLWPRPDSDLDQRASEAGG